MGHHPALVGQEVHLSGKKNHHKGSIYSVIVKADN